MKQSLALVSRHTLKKKKKKQLTVEGRVEASIPQASRRRDSTGGQDRHSSPSTTNMLTEFEHEGHMVTRV